MSDWTVFGLAVILVGLIFSVTGVADSIDKLRKELKAIAKDARRGKQRWPGK